MVPSPVMVQNPSQHLEQPPAHMRSLIERGGLSFFVSNGFTKCVALTNSIIVLAGLTPYAYGVTELALSVVGALSIFQLAGLEKTVTADMGVEYGRGRAGAARRLFVDFFLLLSLCSLAGWALLFFGSNLMKIFFTEEIGSYFVILSFLFLSAPCAIVMRILYNVYLDLSMIAVFTFLQEAFKLVFLVSALFLDSMSIAAVLWSYVFAQVASIVALSPRTVRWVRMLRSHPVEGRLALHRFFFGHNMWTLVSNYLDSVTRSFRLWLIKIFVGTEAVALFAVAQGVVGQLSSFLTINSVVAPILPRYVRNETLFFKIIDKTMKYQFILAVLLILLGFVGVPMLINTFFPHYGAMLPVFALIVFSLIPSSINTVFQTMFYIRKAQRNLFFSQLVRFVLVGVLGGALMPLFGIYGVVCEYIATAVLFTLERYRALRKLYPTFTISIRDIVSYDEYDKMLISRIKQRLWAPMR